MNDKRVPQHRIPKAYPACEECGAGMRTVYSSAYADGYYRRHLCRDTQCGATLYTLSPYDGTTPEMSRNPYKDRPLTLAEEYVRAQWWNEDVSAPINHEVPERMRAAIIKPEHTRSEVDVLLVKVFHALTSTIKELEKKEPSDANNP